MSVSLSVCQSVHPSICPSIRPSICLSSRPSIHQLILPLVCLSIHLTICWPVRSSPLLIQPEAHPVYSMAQPTCIETQPVQPNAQPVMPKTQGKGTADHLLSLGDWLCMFLFINKSVIFFLPPLLSICASAGASGS